LGSCKFHIGEVYSLACYEMQEVEEEDNPDHLHGGVLVAEINLKSWI